MSCPWASILQHAFASFVFSALQGGIISCMEALAPLPWVHCRLGCKIGCPLRYSAPRIPQVSLSIFELYVAPAMKVVLPNLTFMRLLRLARLAKAR